MWYAKGAVFYLEGDDDRAYAAFGEALARVPRHAMAQGGLALLDGRAGKAPTQGGSDARDPGGPDRVSPRSSPPFETFMARVALLVDARDVASAAAVVGEALDHAPPGNAGWLVPLDPLLKVQQNRTARAATLAKLTARAGIWLPPEFVTYGIRGIKGTCARSPLQVEPFVPFCRRFETPFVPCDRRQQRSRQSS